MIRSAFALLVALLLAGPAVAEGPRFSFPVACQVGETCWVLQYFDHDGGPGWADYGCGQRSYNGHTGTDIAIRDLAQMTLGVAVLAAADGVVAATRDGLPDRKPADPRDPELNKIGCGNAVVLDHGGGWRTAYCHLRQGSVLVRHGDAVKRGQPLGKVGLSGLAEFPHVEFNVLKDGKTLDPFTGSSAQQAACGGMGPEALWDESARPQVAYQPVDVRLLTFLSAKPDDAAVFAGVIPLTQLTAGQRPLFVTVQLIGVRTGDTLQVRIDGPDGVVRQQRLDFSKTQIQVTATLPLGEGPWRVGRYTANVTVERGGSWRQSWSTALRVISAGP